MSAQPVVAAGAPVRERASIRVLIVDDSVVARAIIGRMIEAMDGFEVAAAVSNARAALAYLATARVDVILLDLEMPGVGGLAAMPDLIAAGDRAKVLVVSSSAEEGAKAAVQALALGAADTLVKPGVSSFAGRFATVLEDRMRRLVEGPAGAAHAVSRKPAAAADFDIVAIGASTGGIHALSQLIRAIPSSFQPPILVTQHLPEAFMSYFAMQLSLLAGRPSDVAVDHMRVRPGRIYVAPGHAHMRCVRTTDSLAIRLSDEPSLSGCTPSVDPMFESVAAVFGPRGLAVVLSGMGRDGALGAAQVIEAGGSVIAQDRETSVVWGMPGAVADCASAILPPDAIGRAIASGRRPV